MADRSAAALFCSIFDHLAGSAPLTPEAVWAMSQGFDFAPYQMGCDSALRKLGLLWTCASCPRNDGEDAYVYGPNMTACDECGRARAECERRPEP